MKHCMSAPRPSLLAQHHFASTSTTSLALVLHSLALSPLTRLCLILLPPPMFNNGQPCRGTSYTYPADPAAGSMKRVKSFCTHCPPWIGSKETCFREGKQAAEGSVSA